MSHSDWSLLAAAILLLLLGHFVRAMRWALLFPPDYLTSRFRLLLGLAIGYAINAVAPLRVGELLRAIYVSRGEKVRLPFVIGTIVAERVADLAVVALLGLATVSWNRPSTLVSAGLFVGVVLLALITALLIRGSALVRRAVWAMASIFNDRIRLGVLDVAWSTAELLAGGVLVRWRFVVASVGMWLLYLASYFMFARSVHAPPSQVVEAILQQPLASLAESLHAVGAASARVRLLAYAGVPIMLVLGYGALRSQVHVARVTRLVLRHGRSGRGSPRSKRDRFRAASSYESFLAALFSGEDAAVTGFGLAAMDDCIVHKFYAGGSDAITALVEVDERLMIRKFATGEPARKLKVQADWLRDNAAPGLPLVSVTGEQDRPDLYSYDMPLVTPSNDFYDVIHSSPFARNQTRLLEVIARVAALHAASEKGDAPADVVDAYLDTKATANAAGIRAFAREAIGGDEFTINGVEYRLDEWDRLADKAWLRDQVRDRRVATIHGDLTIENIIIAPDFPLGLYIIDPNPENLFNSPLIDWAKLMQSLHLGYEALNRGISCALTGRNVELSSMRSHAYADLHGVLVNAIGERFGADGLREVYFHELVNYLRLTPYKLRQNRAKGLGFFACTAQLLRRYEEQAA